MTKLLKTNDPDVKTARCAVEGGLLGNMFPNLRFKVYIGFLGGTKRYSQSDVENISSADTFTKRSVVDMALGGSIGGLLLGPFGFAGGIFGGSLNKYRRGIYSIQFKDGLQIVVFEKNNVACRELDKLVAMYSFDKNTVDFGGESV